MINRYIAYYRVSTNKQKNSGLGLSDQKVQVANYVKSTDGNLISEYEDVESGSKNDRYSLVKALEHCSLTNSILIIAKLDRLSRNVAFLAQLLESHVSFVCCDNPHANKLTIHILAAVAEEERRLISQRTKAALAQAKLNGVKLGTNNLPTSNSHTALRARKSKTQLANIFNLKILNRLEVKSSLSYRQQADFLNGCNITTRQGFKWHANSVKRIYQLNTYI